MWLGCFIAVALSAIVTAAVTRLVTRNTEVMGCSGIVAGVLSFVLTRPSFTEESLRLFDRWEAHSASATWFDPLGGVIFGGIIAVVVTVVALVGYALRKRIA